MERLELRRRADGLDRIVRVGRWSWVWPALAGTLIVGPLVLCAAFDLPAEVLASPPMTIWVAIWTVFRNLDVPRPTHRPTKRRRRRRLRPAAVIPLRLSPGAPAPPRGSDPSASPR